MKDNRRNFIKASALTVAASAMALGTASNTASAAILPNGLPNLYDEDSHNDIPKVTPKLALPTAAQAAWMDLGFGLFVHFGINTFYDTEWSDGTLDPIKYNPGSVDTDQWCATAKAAGMKYVVIITKHHDGFCNFYTDQTAYNVKNTPFGKDLVGMVVDSARKHGLKVGLYYSLWDRHEKSHNDNEDAYVDFMKRQLKELLTNYGPIVELWFDGMWKKQRTGWQDAKGKKAKPEAFMVAWRNEGAYRWQMDSLYRYIKSLQPDILVMNNATTEYPGVPLFPVDIRSGEKATGAMADNPYYNFSGDDRYLPLQIETTMSRKGSGQFTSGSWFWHPEDHSAATHADIRGWLADAKKNKANLLLNVGPMSNGKLRPEDLEVLSTFKG